MTESDFRRYLEREFLALEGVAGARAEVRANAQSRRAR